jgi:7,8-dihydropterin-6-yl-methyl-4-(beta-D-ribofuranosyl)aminobenzene 5'-phosphate synthase
LFKYIEQGIKVLTSTTYIGFMIKKLKITTIADNLVLQAGLWGQWGLSFLLELTDAKGDDRKVLFDTANDKEPFLYNVDKLELNLTDLDAIVLSHGHSDHTVATVEALEMTSGCRVYAHPHCFMPRYYQSKSGKKTKVGVPEGQGVSEIEAAGGELILSDAPVEVVPGLWTTGQIPRVTDFEHIPKPSEGRKRVIIVDGEEKDDQILCDQSLWMEIEGSGCWIITGCAHSGPVNTLKRVSELGGFNEIYAYIGGTHLVGQEDSYIMRTADELKKYNLKLFSPCHCTGFNAMSILHKEFRESFAVNYCGRVFNSWEKTSPMVL